MVAMVAVLMVHLASWDAKGLLVSMAEVGVFLEVSFGFQAERSLVQLVYEEVLAVPRVLLNPQREVAYQKQDENLLLVLCDD